MIVYLSPSDQSGNTTASADKHSEKDHCTQIAYYCAKYLEELGHRVYVGDNSKVKTYTKRVEDSNNKKADLHICIHTNAGGGEGTTIFTQAQNVNNKYVQSVYKSVSELSPGKDRGIHANNTFYEINHCNTTTIYVECEFHDRSDLEKWIDENVENIGKAIADGIGLCEDERVEPQKVVDDTVITIYRVQVGAFRNRTYAREKADTMSKHGFDTYIRLENDGLYHVQLGAFHKKEYAEALAKRVKDVTHFNTYIKVTNN